MATRIDISPYEYDFETDVSLMVPKIRPNWAEIAFRAGWLYGGNLKPIKVYVNGTTTVVEWSDGRKTKAGLNNEVFDIEKGIAMAIARRFVGRADFISLEENAQRQLNLK